MSYQCTKAKLISSLAFAVALLAISTVAPQTLRAAVLIYEPFNYGGATGLSGQGGGSEVGLAGVWADTTNAVNTGGYVNSSVTMPNLPFTPSGGSYQTTSTAPTDNDDYIRAFDGFSIDLSQNGVHYFSFLMTRTDGGASPDAVQVGFGTAAADATNAGVGSPISIGSTSGDQQFIRLDNGGANNLSDGAASSVGTFFVVGKIESNAVGADVVSATWYDAGDIIPLAEPVSFAETASANMNDIINRLRVFGGNNSNAQLDEIRIATTYSEAIGVVPEPSSLLICSLFGCGLAARPRRRRGGIRK